MASGGSNFSGNDIIGALQGYNRDLSARTPYSAIQDNQSPNYDKGFGIRARNIQTAPSSPSPFNYQGGGTVSPRPYTTGNIAIPQPVQHGGGQTTYAGGTPGFYQRQKPQLFRVNGGQTTYAGGTPGFYNGSPYRLLQSGGAVQPRPYTTGNIATPQPLYGNRSAFKVY